MKPTEQLKEEHEAIKIMLGILDKISARLKSGEKVSTEHLDRALEFIQVFADKCHHGKEEDILFPAMEEAGIPKEGGPLGVMLEEHGWGRDYVKEMSDGISAYKKGDAEASSKIAENAAKYVALLNDHIYKEEEVLYPLADDHISIQKQEELLQEFDRAERDKIGPGKHEELHKLLRELQAVYLE